MKGTRVLFKVFLIKLDIDYFKKSIQSHIPIIL